MFDWFGKTFRRREYPTWNDVPDWNKVNNDMNKITEDMEKVIPFPETAKAPPMPEVKAPKEKSTVFYRFGVTNNNRLAFQLGYSELTMNKQGVQNLIDQLEFFKSQLDDFDEEDETMS